MFDKQETMMQEPINTIVGMAHQNLQKQNRCSYSQLHITVFQFYFVPEKYMDGEKSLFYNK
jgi:hypothetical protein